MNIQALIAFLAGIAGIIGGGIALIHFLVERGYKTRINKYYELLGGSQSRLGIPISNIEKAYPSRFGTRGGLQRFHGNGDGVRVWDGEQQKHIIGVSIYSSNKGTFATWGSIGWWYEKNDGTGGRLGFPTSHEQQIGDSPKTWVQQFEGGKITCVADTDPTIEYTS
jgi:uncharacterized protein with LGFP repeats